MLGSQPIREFGRACFAALAALCFLVAPARARDGAPSEARCRQVPEISRELSEITGLSWRHPVPCSFIDKQQVNAFLKRRLKEEASPEDIRAEELTLKKFGLVPPDYDLAASTVALLTEQAAAFYDYNKRKLFLTDATSGESEGTVLAHELAHALADQNFNLARYIRQGRKSDDGSTARLSVMEGQATWLMSEYAARRLGQTLMGNQALAASMAAIGDSGDSQFPVFENAPLYLRRSMVFPYTEGMVFQGAVLERDHQRGFAEVFTDPPVSTQQIQHPEKYFAKVTPTQPDLPDPHLPRGYRGLIRGELGELEHAILLEQYVGKSQAEEVAPHWRGCRFELRENKKAARVVLLYAVEWDDGPAAAKYFSLYRRILAKKWKHMTVDTETADRVSGLGDDGRFELRRTGAIVTSVEGMDPKPR
ncbi:MAG TPA: hypothetical protein VIN93_15275 [Bryobacteraceae bacterium]|jgi:hypothetical protein